MSYEHEMHYTVLFRLRCETHKHHCASAGRGESNVAYHNLSCVLATNLATQGQLCYVPCLPHSGPHKTFRTVHAVRLWYFGSDLFSNEAFTIASCLLYVVTIALL